jgi:hypothetical protein
VEDFWGTTSTNQAAKYVSIIVPTMEQGQGQQKWFTAAESPSVDSAGVADDAGFLLDSRVVTSPSLLS